VDIKDLEVYKRSRELSKIAWEVYKDMNWRDKKIMGDQFIQSIDSIGANIAEGFGRYHYLDKNKFNYNARGSLIESIHWLELLTERDRDIIKKEKSTKLLNKLHQLGIKLNNYITTTKNQTKQKITI